MKNKLSILSVIAVLIIAVSGCGLISRMQKSTVETGNSRSTESNKTLTDKTVETAVGDEKIGVPECDDLLDYFAQESKSNDENYVTKATRQYFMNKIRESIKQSMEENKGDKVKMAKECKEYRKQIDKYKAEEESNKQ